MEMELPMWMERPTISKMVAPGLAHDKKMVLVWWACGPALVSMEHQLSSQPTTQTTSQQPDQTTTYKFVPSQKLLMSQHVPRKQWKSVKGTVLASIFEKAIFTIILCG
jgi:hypothetical protein